MFPSNNANDRGSEPDAVHSPPECTVPDGATAKWHGTYTEEWALLVAIIHQSPDKPLSAAESVFGSQRVLDHLLFGLHERERFITEEWREAAA